MGRKKRENFSKKMTDILNFGALNLALGIGYRTGLFDVLDGFDTPKTASTIAGKADLNARYVREWLGIMVCGGIVELTLNDAGDDLFFFPKEHGDLMATRSGRSRIWRFSGESRSTYSTLAVRVSSLDSTR